ncbi:MAG: uracil-DNA glycosylase [Planctomycetota bacterium]|nr:uracil-DNA glycosylase [Planctomycetota bacterium]
MTRHKLDQINQKIVRCKRCPELREYCAEVARTKRKSFQDWDYWGKPVPGFGDGQAKILIVGLAPAAHGANRTGRMFTGDRSGDFLYAALHRAGLANQSHATDRDDGLTLKGVYIAAPLRCAPPGNKPTPTQLDACRSYLQDEVLALQPRLMLALGGIGWNVAIRILSELGETVPRPKPKFGHGAEVLIGSYHLLGCYHVSQQNTFTGRLTEPMIDAVLDRAKALSAR